MPGFRGAGRSGSGSSAPAAASPPQPIPQPIPIPQPVPAPTANGVDRPAEPRQRPEAAAVAPPAARDISAFEASLAPLTPTEQLDKIGAPRGRVSLVFWGLGRHPPRQCRKERLQNRCMIGWQIVPRQCIFNWAYCDQL